MTVAPTLHIHHQRVATIPINSDKRDEVLAAARSLAPMESVAATL